MKVNRMIGYIAVLCCLFSFQNIDRDKLVDKSTIAGMDYRIFQSTPAWDLAKAVQDGDGEKIKNLLAKNPKLIDYQEPKFGNTLLMLTVFNQQKNSLEILLANNADVSLHDSFSGASSLIDACGNSDIGFVKLLIQHGANVNDIEVGERKEGNSTRFTPLMASARKGDIEAVKLLIEKGAKLNYENEYGESAFSKAIRQNNYEIVLYLLQNGADYTKPIFYRDNEHRNLYILDVMRENLVTLHTSTHKFKMEVADFLKSKGLDYQAAPIPEYIKNKAKEKYPNSWQEYLKEY